MSVANTLLEYLLEDQRELPPLQDVERVLEEVLRLCSEYGGATYNFYFGNQTGQPAYAVGLHPVVSLHVAADDGERLRLRLRQFVHKYQTLLNHPRCCLGIWQQDATAWIDISVLVYNPETAIQFGRSGNQIAIFALEQGEVLATQGTGSLLASVVSPEERLAWIEQNDRLPVEQGE